MKKAQTFKNVGLTRTVVKNNILKVWKLSLDSDRYDWYMDANVFAKSIASDGSEAATKIACGVIAALSPVKTWEQNMKLAQQVLQAGATTGHMKMFMDKALAIQALALDSEDIDGQILTILSGRKIQSFYTNIAYPEQSTHVTIDRHALSIALGYWVTEEEYSGMTAAQYQFFRDCYIHAADSISVSPLLLQSATWVVWRRIKTDYRPK